MVMRLDAVLAALSVLASCRGSIDRVLLRPQATVIKIQPSRIEGRSSPGRCLPAAAARVYLALPLAHKDHTAGHSSTRLAKPIAFGEACVTSLLKDAESRPP